MTLTEEQRGTVGFDLEKNRAAIDSAINSLLCEGWDNEASTVRRLVAEIERLRASLVEHEEHENQTHAILGTDDTLENVAKRAAARIKELEADNQNLVTLNKSLMNNDWILRDNNRKYRKRAQKAELQNKELNSKIGPGARPPCWQITEERIGLLEYCLETLLDAPDIEEIPGPGHSIEVLRAMLTEAGV